MCKDKDTHYYEQVYDLVRLIPSGRVTTYGHIADYLSLGSARMVGWALNQSHSTMPDLPAHRVVNRKGELSGRHHFDPDYSMESRLHNDGVEVENNKIVRFEELLWIPMEQIF